MRQSRWLVAAVAGSVWYAMGAGGQEVGPLTPPPIQLASNGPIFYSVTHGHRVDARSNTALRRRIALTLTNTPIASALDVVADQAGLQINYNASALPPNARVTLSATNITVAAALTVVLLDANVDVQMTGDNRATLVRRTGLPPLAASPVQQGGAAISGYVRDSATGASIPQVAIRVDGTTLETKSGSDGLYKITGVTPGEYRVSARRVGYIARTRTLTVPDGQSATLNFLLNPPATKLDEVVTTAIGDQRRYQVGNVISTINVDSIAPTAPVTSVTDLLSSRVPGLEVIETGGLVGSGESIRIRGESSLLLSNDPIIIVDGIRVDNTPGGTSINNTAVGAVPSPSRINDIDFSQIATIDVLKGPAATTEYGTDAANGVIIITTKRGTSGKPQWNVSAEQDEAAIPTNFPNYYYAWGHATNGSNAATECPLYVSIQGYTSLTGGCEVDSVTAFNPLNHAATSIFQPAPTTKYDLSVSGGTDAETYVVAGGLTNAIGAVGLPSVFRSEAVALGFPASSFRPNAENQRSVRVNGMIRLSSAMDLQISSAYMSTYQETPGASEISDPSLNEYGQPFEDDSAGCYGYCQYPYASGNPIWQLGQQANQQTNRLTGGMTLNWRPRGWLSMNATIGIDHGNQEEQSVVLPQAELLAGGDTNSGSYALTEGTTDVYTSQFRASVTAAVSRLIRATTSLGMNLADTRSQSLNANTFYDITSTNLTLDGATNPDVSQASIRQATLGGYIDEQIAFAERLFLDLSWREDAGSGFGSSYSLQPYYGAQVSWLALNARSTTIRLRGSIGESGVQPSDATSSQIDQASTVWYNGGQVSSSTITAVGNPELQPERSVEYEGGMDLAFWNNRLTVELTGYSKTTFNDLVSQPLGFDIYGNASVTQNLGEVRNTGIEVSATATPIQTRTVVWTIAANGALNTNKLISFAPGALAAEHCSEADGVVVGDGEQCDQVGYPLNGYFVYANTTYTDRNHDGIIEANELVTESLPDWTYKGSLFPDEGSVQTTIGFWRNILSVGAVMDFSGGNKVFDFNENQNDSYAQTRAANVIGEPLSLQAAAAEAADNTFTAASADYVDGSYLSFRELNLTYTLPRRWAQRLRLTTLSITGAVRNLALWTSFPGDPEVSNANTSGDVRINGAGAVPLARTWFVRLNLGL